MKRFLMILVLLFALITLAACATHASRENVDTARQALEIVDRFLFRPQADPDATYRQLAALPQINTTPTGNARRDEANQLLRDYMSNLQTVVQATRHIYSAQTRLPVLEVRNQLASEIGVRTRR